MAGLRPSTLAPIVWPWYLLQWPKSQKIGRKLPTWPGINFRTLQTQCRRANHSAIEYRVASIPKIGESLSSPRMLASADIEKNI